MTTKDLEQQLHQVCDSNVIVNGNIIIFKTYLYL